MTGKRQKFDAAELADLKERTLLSDLFKRYGVSGRGKGKAIWANCCFHGEKTPSLKINDSIGEYYCFGCGARGDHFDLLREVGGNSFAESVEILGGVRLITVEERAAVEAREQKWKEEDRKAREKGQNAAERLFKEGKPIEGTQAAAYFAARGLTVVPKWTFDLRFMPSLRYTGFANAEAEEPSDLGSFPAIVAAIRNRDGKLIGAHRTYLDPQEPRKLLPPGDGQRNKAKKVLGEQRGGMILLSPPAENLAMGEGIETSRAWFAFGMASQAFGTDNVAVAAAVSLGNLSGGATGSSPHPTIEKRTVPNGIPDMDRPGVILPANVKRLAIIGDGDSDPYMTRARILVGARRARSFGIDVCVSMAPDGFDFADLLISDQQVQQ